MIQKILLAKNLIVILNKKKTQKAKEKPEQLINVILVHITKSSYQSFLQPCRIPQRNSNNYRYHKFPRKPTGP